jgi:hypothetical protein
MVVVVLIVSTTNQNKRATKTLHFAHNNNGWLAGCWHKKWNRPHLVDSLLPTSLSAIQPYHEIPEIM